MPVLETADGKPVDASEQKAVIDAKFDASMNDDGPDEQAPPRRTPKPADEQPKTRRTRQPKAEQSRTAEKSAAPVPEATPEVTAKRAENVAETFQIVGGALELIGKSAKSKSFRADGLFLTYAAPKIGDAVAGVAKYDPAMARLVDKSGGGGKVTAYLGLFAVTASLGAQIAANHRLLKPGLMGSVSADEIIDALDKPAEAEAEAPADVPQAA
jgi:hypothetical protein